MSINRILTKGETMNKIKVIVVEPEKEPYIKEIDDTLEAKQKLVGGDIEIVSSFFSDKVDYDFIINEEGKIRGLPLNRWIWDKKDAVVGNLIIAKSDYYTGEFVDMDDNDISFVLEKIKTECPKFTFEEFLRLHPEHDLEEVER